MAAEKLVAFLYVCSVLVTAPLSFLIADPDRYGSPLQWVTSVILWAMVLVLLVWWSKLKWLTKRIERKVFKDRRALEEENETLRERLRQIVKEYEDTGDFCLASLLEKGLLKDRFDAVGRELHFLVWQRDSAESEVMDREATSSRGGEDHSKVPASVMTPSKPGQGFQLDEEEVKRRLEIHAVLRANTTGRLWRSNHEELLLKQIGAGDCCV